jgi:hypothetical protein
VFNLQVAQREGPIRGVLQIDRVAPPLVAQGQWTGRGDAERHGASDLSNAVRRLLRDNWQARLRKFVEGFGGADNAARLECYQSQRDKVTTVAVER